MALALNSHVKILFLISLAVAIFAGHMAKAGSSRQMDCTGQVFSQSHLLPMTLPETNEITEKTGIRFFALTKETYDADIKETFKPQLNFQQRDAFAITLAQALKSFPVSFLRNSSNLCFVLVDNFPMAAAVTSNNVVITASDVGLSIIFHEIMHAVDFVHWAYNAESSWNALNQKWSCTYDKNALKKPINPLLENSDSCFASPYGHTDWMEDRAEIFAAMVMDYPSLMKKVTRNPALNEKFESVKEFLMRISGDVDDIFWIYRSSFLKREYYYSCGGKQSCAFDLSAYQSHSDWNQ